jgi:type VI protein secretion system component Hcp
MCMMLRYVAGPILTYKASNAAVISVDHSGKESEFIEDIMFTFETIDVQSKNTVASFARN